MSIDIKQNVPLAPYTTLGVGGIASFFVTVRTDAELEEAVMFAQERHLALRILGGGSNVLIADGLISGLVIQIASKGIHHEIQGTDVVLTIASGEFLDDVVLHSVEKGWWGIENLSHIPGTVGAAPVQNVGAYGVEIKDCVRSVRVFDTQVQQFLTLSNEQCDFGYRDSLFKTVQGKKYIVTEVTFLLSTVTQPKLSYRDLANYFKDEEPTLADIRAAVIEIRSKKFPNWKEIGTAGSFFKNPIISKKQFDDLKKTYPELPGFSADNQAVKVSLGWILDKVLHLRGFTEGNVATYSEQALVLVASKNATAREIETFANKIVEKIKNETQISVEWEVSKIK